MGIVFSNGITIYAGQSFANTDAGASNFLTFVNSNMQAAGWSSQIIQAQLTFQAQNLNKGNEFFGPNGQLVIWSGPNPPAGFIVVPLGIDLQTTANNLIGPLATIAGGVSGGVTPSGGFFNLKITNIVRGTDAAGNNASLSVFPTGSVGIFDYGNAVGNGLSHSGGFSLTSQIFSGSPVNFQIVKPTSIGILIIEPITGTSLDAFLFANTIQLIVNKYQIFIFIPGFYAGGSFFVAGHLFPLGSLTQFNLFNGPSIHGGGGVRNTGLTSLISGNPVINGTIRNPSNLSVQLPGFVTSGTSGLNLVRDTNSLNGNLQGLFYDSIICDKTDGIGALFWDSFITSVSPSMDTLASYGVYGLKDFYCILSFNSSGQTNAAFMVAKQNVSGSQIFPQQVDSSVPGDTTISDLLGPSALINVVNPLTGIVPKDFIPPTDDYAF